MKSFIVTAVATEAHVRRFLVKAETEEDALTKYARRQANLLTTEVVTLDSKVTAKERKGSDAD